MILVCANLAEFSMLEKELRGLEAASQEYPQAAKRILTLTRDTVPAQSLPRAQVQPAYEWLLEDGR
jgi:hypothetical protein